MTGVELPQVSLQRYVDLVRRRRWQLVPVSLLGLVVGAVVAFLIPRYYVADTLIERREIDGEFPDRVDDPLRSIVQGAQLMLPGKVSAAIERLKWPEWAAGDPSERTLIEKEVRSRVAISDSNVLERARNYVLIRVTYRDTRAARAADLANTLVQTWIDESLAEMRKDHEDLRQRANVAYGNANERFDHLLTEEQDIVQRFHIRPDLDTAVANAEVQRRRDDLRKDRTDLEMKRFARDQLADTIKRDEEKLRAMPERVPLTEANVTVWATQLVERKLAPIAVLDLVKAWAVMKNSSATPGSIVARQNERKLKFFEMRLMLVLAIVPDARGEMPNLDFMNLSLKLEGNRATLLGLDKEVAALDARLAAEQAEQDALPEGMKQLKDNQEKRRQAQLEVTRQFDKLRTQEDILRALEARKPMQQVQPAKPPPHPTDPNVFIVALIGAVLGLGVAVGLILLLDMLQGSFKTLEDVERGLGVPVLGGMSHLETEEERTTLARGRRRAAVAAFAFVALVAVVITFYYVRPSSLPGVVRDLLRGLLGS